MTPPPLIQFGIETEIGIARDNDEHLDVVSESIALVRSVVEPGVLMRWDYGSEDPHADMRGFHVEELRQDTDEASYFAQDSERELSFVEIKSDLVLGNGARYYNDHAHPEYCTPECSTLEELVAQDRAVAFSTVLQQPEKAEEYRRQFQASEARVEEALAELVALGLVSSDSFGGLRALLVPSAEMLGVEPG